ncbi:MAG: zinc-dependent metalloprotease family protein, partial [Phycisphaerales bacterium]|nr:zinc-dependent metalloprotease family protein [Phycisphaerales bacterium]
MMKFTYSLIVVFVLCLAPGRWCVAGTTEDEVKHYSFAEFGDLTAEKRSSTPYAWEGRFEVGGAKGDLFDVSTRSGSVVIMRLDDGRIIHRLPAAGGGETVLVHHPSDVEPCSMIEPGSDLQVEMAGHRRTGDCDDGSVIDVLVKWTPVAAVESGGDVQMRSLAEACIAFSNHVYAQSGIGTRLRGVGFGVTEDYSGDSGDLDLLYKITDPYDGVLDDLHSERDAVGADLVAVLQGVSDYYCGRAWLYGGTGSAAYGFSLSVWSCAIGNLTFPHEIGHNQGCCH